ncbi:MAG: hypothetical protein Q4F41_07765 [Eubacteriales bacterium]|nr:hypothetical protein [Eubacteriales bacterium]
MGKRLRKSIIGREIVWAMLTFGCVFGVGQQTAKAEEGKETAAQYGTFEIGNSRKAIGIGEKTDAAAKTDADAETETPSLSERFSGLGEGNTLGGSVLTQSTAGTYTQKIQAYRYWDIQDSSTGKVVAHCMAPSDYTVSGEVIWCGRWQSAGAPGQVYATALSPDQNTVLGYYSPVVYEHILDYSMGGVSYNQHQDGAFDSQTLTPMLQFMTAETYCDYMAQTILSGQQLELVGQTEMGADMQKRMDEKANEMYQQMTSLMQGTGCSVDGVYVGIAERSYAVSLDGYPFRLNVLAATDGSQCSFSTEILYGGTVHTSYISWEAPLVYFMLTPEAEYEANRDIYEQFLMNTCFSDQFADAFTRAKDQIMQQMLSNGSTSMEAARDYCESSVSASMGTGATYDAEQFSDYILSQNDYTLPDGEHVKIPVSYDYVYADDMGNVYVSNTADQPAGTTQLNPN